MLFGNQHLYEQARAAKLGESSLSAELENLRRAIGDAFSVNVLFVVLDKVELGPAEGRPRLIFILDTADDCAKLRTLEAVVKQTIIDEYAQIISHPQSVKLSSETPIIVFDDFSAEATRQTLDRFAETSASRIADELADLQVWHILSCLGELIVFYQTDEDVATNKANGQSDKIKQRRCYDLACQHDEFGYFRPESFPIKFDSKENVDANYNGSLGNYFR